MFSATTQLHPADQHGEDAQYYRRVLHELIDMGVDLARAVHRQATCSADAADPASDPAATPVLGAAVAFDRISHAIRRTVALARKIAEPLPPRAAAGQDRVAARRRIIREVEDVIQRKAEGADADALRAELSERLDAPELEDEIDGRPVAEVIADICRDLGLAAMPGTHPWKRRTPGDVAALYARAAQSPAVARATQPRAAPSPSVARTPSYSREAGIELLHRLLPLTPPIRGP